MTEKLEAMLSKLIEQAQAPSKYDHQYDSQDVKNKFYWSSEWRKLKSKVLIRDNNECQVCKSMGKVTLNHLIVHHIKPIEYYPSMRLDKDNLITVCIECHNKIHGMKANKWKDDEWW